MEKKGLVDQTVNLKKTYTILSDGKKAEKKSFDATLKLELATKDTQHALAISDLKFKLKEKDLVSDAFESKVKSQSALLGTLESKSKKFDEMMAHTMRSRMQMKDVHEKASVRYVYITFLSFVLTILN